jgi:hypothetical protein
VGFRDIDTDEAGMFHDPSLHMRTLSAHGLFGFDDGTVGLAPSSRTVFRGPEGDGLPPTFTHPSVVLRTAATRTG